MDVDGLIVDVPARGNDVAPGVGVIDAGDPPRSILLVGA
jgi:hypothetical protein